jgi:ankyrin repeat protein
VPRGRWLAGICGPALLTAVLAGCARSEPPPVAARVDSPPVAQPTDAEPQPKVASSSDAAPAEDDSPYSADLGAEASAGFRDEGWLASAGFLTSESGLDAARLQAAFVDAACTSSGDLTVRFLQAGYSPDSVNPAGLTALHCAAGRGDRDTVRLLLDRGADADATTWLRGFTPLHYAALGKHTDIVELLVNAGADVDAQSTWGPALMLALREPERHQPRLDPETTIPADYLRWVRLGASVAIQDLEGNSLLHLAAQRSNQAWAADLLERGAKIDVRNEKGETPLVVAMNHLVIDGTSKPSHTRQLPLLRANVDDVDAQGDPLVVRLGHSPDLLPLFKEAGADFNAVGKHCNTFWRRLMDYAWGYMPEHVYVEVFDKADQIAKIDEAPTAGGRRCHNALHIAAGTGDPRLVEYFLKRGLDPNARGEYGYTPLHVLASNTPMDRRPQEPAVKALELLLDADADVNVRDDNGRTLMEAASRRSEAFREKLARAGAR